MPELKDEGTVPVRVSVRDARPVRSRTLFALVDVDIEIGGVMFSLVGVQARSMHAAGTEIMLPQTRHEDGSWSSAVILPPDLLRSLTDAVLLFLQEEGLAHNRLLRSFASANQIGQAATHDS